MNGEKIYCALCHSQIAFSENRKVVEAIVNHIKLVLTFHHRSIGDCYNQHRTKSFLKIAAEAGNPITRRIQ